MSESQSFSKKYLGENLFVVFGASKSGTTWLQKLLDSHPDIRCHFQLRLFPFSPVERKRLKSTAKSVVYSKHSSPFNEVFETEQAEHEYWLKTALFQHLATFIESSLKESARKYSIPEQAADEVFKDLYRKFIEAVLIEKGKKVVGTKTYANLSLMFELFPNSKCIYLTRNGKDVCVSKRFHFARKGTFFHGDEKSRILYSLNRIRMIRRFLRRLPLLSEDHFEIPKNKDSIFTPDILKKLAEDWAFINEYLYEWKNKKPDQVFLVTYEELNEDTPTVLQRVFDYLNVETDKELMEQIVFENSFDQLKKSKNDSFFRKGQVGDWRNHFSARDLQLYDRIAGEISGKLGYE